MKKKILFLSMITLFFGASMQSQKINDLSLDEYKSIKLNNILMYKVSNTFGDLNTLNNLFNFNFSLYTDTEYIKIIKLTSLSNGLEMTFQDDNLSNFKITNNKSNLKIKGATITIGDNISKLGAVDKNFNTVEFTCRELLGTFEIKFDRETSKIIKISFLSLD